MNASHHFAAIMDTAPPEARTVPAIVRAVGLVARVRRNTDRLDDPGADFAAFRRSAGRLWGVAASGSELHMVSSAVMRGDWRDAVECCLDWDDFDPSEPVRCACGWSGPWSEFGACCDDPDRVPVHPAACLCDPCMVADAGPYIDTSGVEYDADGFALITHDLESDPR